VTGALNDTTGIGVSLHTTNTQQYTQQKAEGQFTVGSAAAAAQHNCI
jgi:hypothetical protein